MPFHISPVRSAGAVLLAAMLGCSPTEKTSTLSPSESDTPFQSGQLSGATAGPVSSPVTTTGSGATVTGLVGRFTRLGFEPGGGSPGGDPIGATPVFFSAVGPPDQNFHIWRTNYDGSDVRQLTSDTIEYGAAADPQSHRVAYWRKEDGSPSSPLASIRTILDDGTDPHTVFTVFCDDGLIWWGPDGRILYGQGCDQSGLNEVGADGSNPVRFFDRPYRGAAPVSSAAGQFVLVARDNFFPDFTSAIFRVNYPGRDTTFLLVGDSTDFFTWPAVSRTEPFRFAYWANEDDTLNALHVGLVSDVTQTHVIYRLPAFGGARNFPPCIVWAPDGNNLIIRATSPAGVGQYFVMDTLGNLGRQITHQEGGVLACPSVGVPDSGGGSGSEPVVLIGESGLFGSTASGLIASQGAGGALQAVVAFRGAPQRSVKLETGTGLNSTAPVLTYTLTADRLTALAFTGFPAADSAIQVIDSTMAPAASGALITFDAASGAVSLILPFSTVNLNQMPSVTDAGNSRTFRGTFLAAYDRRGRNLAPNGATEAVLDLKTNAVRVNR